MMRVSWPDKYPDETFLAGVDWAPLLGDGESVTSVDFEVLVGDVVLSEEAISGTETRVRVSAGAAGIQEVLCTAETSDDNTLQQVAEFVVKAEPA